MASLGTIWAELGIRLDKFDKGIRDAEAKIKKAEERFEGFQKAGERLGDIGKTLTMGITLPIAGVAAAAVKMTADFEQAMANAASVSGATAEELKKMEQVAREMGATTAFSAKEAADAMYYMACQPPDELIITGEYRVAEIGSYRENHVIGSAGLQQRVLKHTLRPCTEGFVLKIKPLLQPAFRVTPNHPVLVVRGKPCRPYQQHGESNSPSLCNPSCRKKQREKCTKKYYVNYTPEFIPAGDIQKGDILLIPRIKEVKETPLIWEHRTRKKLPAVLDSDLAYFLGLMTGDGWADDERVFCVFNNKDKESKDWLCSYLEGLGYSVHERPQINCVQVVAWSRPLAALVTDWIGRGAQNKRIPPAIFNSSPEIVISYLKGYFASDGYVSHETGVLAASTVSPNIAYTINYLAAKVGMAFSIGTTKGCRKEMPSGYLSDCKRIYTISTTNPDYIYTLTGIKTERTLRYNKFWFDEDYLYLPVWSIQREDYHGMVYNLETEDHTYSTGVIVHNSAGWKANQMAEAIKPTLDLAAATQSDLAFTTDTVIATLNQFGLQAQDTERVTNVFAAAIGNSQATMDKLAYSMRYVGPVAHALGYSIEESTAALMGLYDAGFKGEQAGTVLRGALSRLMDPSEDVVEALTSLGLKVEDVNPQVHSLADIIDKLKSRNIDAATAVQLFGQEAGPGMLALIAQGGNALRQYEATITGTQAAIAMAEKQLDTFAGQMKILWSAISEVAIQLGQILIPVLRDLVEKYVMPAVQWFSNLDEGTKKIIITVALLAAAIGPLLVVFGVLFGAVAQIAAGIAALKGALLVVKGAFLVLTGPIGLIIAAVAALAVGAYSLIKHWDAVKEFFVGLWETVKGTFLAAWEWIKQVFLDYHPVGLVIKHWDIVSGFFINLWETVKQIFVTALNTIIDFFGGLPARISEVLAEAGAWLSKFFIEDLPYWTGYAVGALIRFFLDLPGNIWDGLKLAAGKMTEWSVIAWNWAKDTGSRLVADFIDWVRQLPDRVWEWLVNTVVRLRQFTAEARERTIEAGRSILENVITFVRELPGRIWDWLLRTAERVTSFALEARTRAISAGMNIVTGIMDTIRSLPGEVWNILTQTAQRLLDIGGTLWRNAREAANNLWNGFKRGLGIASPSYIEKALERIIESSREALDKLKKDFSALSRLKAEPQITLGVFPVPVYAGAGLTPRQVMAGAAPPVIERGRTIQINGPLFNVENQVLSDEVDAEIVFRELRRQIATVF